MGAEIDRLEIQIETSAKEANTQLDKLVNKLDRVQNALTSISGVSSLNGVSTGAKGAIKNFNALTLSSNKLLKSSNKLTASFTKMYVGLNTLRRGFNALKDSVSNSMGYIENLNYFNSALGQVAQKADLSAWGEMGAASAEEYYNSFSRRAKELTSKMAGFNINDDGTLTATGNASLGIDPSKLMNYQAMFAQMSSSMGVASETSLKLSQALTEIGADLASVKNMDFDKVWTDMASGLAGMSRTLDKYGVNIRNVNLQQKLTELGINANITALNQNDKALLRTIILLDSTRYAWGDLADTLNQPANQVRLLTSNLSNLSRTIGNLFMPVLSKVLPYINGFVIALQRLVTWVGNLLGIDLSQITSAVGSSEVDIGGLIDETDNLGDSLDDADKSAKKLKSNLQGFDELNVITTQDDSGSADIGGGLPSGLLDGAFDDIFSEYQAAWDKAFDEMENKAQAIADKIEKFFKKIYTKSEPLRNALERLIKPLKIIGGGIGKGFLNVLETLAGIAFNGLVLGLNGIAAGLEFITDVAPPETWELLGTAIGGFVVSVLAFKSFIAISNKIQKAFSALNDSFTLIAAHPYAAVASAIIGLSVALISLDNAFREKLNAKWDITEIELYGDTIENLKEKALEFSDAVSISVDERKEKMSEISSVEIPYLESLAEKYNLLAGKTGLTTEEQFELNSVTQEMLNMLPDLQSYYDETTGKLNITREALSKLVEEKKRDLMLDALSESWTENLKMQVEAQKNLKEATDNLSTAQSNLNAEYQKMDNYRSQFSDQGAVNLQDFHESIAAFSEQVDSLSKDVLLYADALETLESEADTYETMYAEWTNATSNLSEDFSKLGEETGNAYAEGIENTTNVSVEAAKNMANGALAEVNSLYDDMYSAGEDAMKGFSAGIESLRPEIEKQTKSIGENVAKEIKTALDIHSPSRVMFSLGEFTMEGFQLGMENLYGNIQKSVSEFSGTLQYDIAPSPQLSYADIPSSAFSTTEYNSYSYYDSTNNYDAVETNMLLRELISAVKEGSTIEIDGTPVFKTVLKKNREAAGLNRSHMLMSY